MQTDPIGYGDGMNMYAYVRGNPVNFRDPSGLDTSGTVTVCRNNAYVYVGEDPGAPKAHCWTITLDSPWGPTYARDPRLGDGGGGGGVSLPTMENIFNYLTGATDDKSHEYDVDVDTKCSADELFDMYLDGGTAPGAGRPIDGQTVRNVELTGNNWIRQTIDYANRTVLNETLRGLHTFDPGTVFIRISSTEGGSNISIVGKGSGEAELLNRAVFDAFFRGGALGAKISCALMSIGD